MRLRVGLVGLGDVWQMRHAPALRALADRFEVRAICDPVRHRAEQAATEFDAEAVDGYHVLVQREDIDAVLVLSPHWFRALPILAACESRKAIYCAVGLDLDADEAESIKRRVEEAGIAFMAEFPKRQAPATIRLKELIATQLGAPRLLFCHRRSVSEAVPRHRTVAACRRDVSAHYRAGRLVSLRRRRPTPTYVMGLVHRTGEDAAEDYRMLSVDFSPRGKAGHGPVAQISSGRYIPPQWQEAISYHPLAELQVSCMRGIAFVDLPSTLVWFDEAGRHQESLDSERPIGERLLTQFYRSVTSLVRRTRDLEDACLAMRVVQAGRQSHEEGRRVEL